MQGNEVDSGRRKFLNAVRGAGLIGAAAALLGRPARIEAATVEAEPAETGASRGYHETEHIRKYYYAARYF